MVLRSLSATCASAALATLLGGCATVSLPAFQIDVPSTGQTGQAGQTGVSGSGAPAAAGAGCELVEAKLPFPREDQASDVVLADFNGDGKLDVAVAANTDGNKKPATVRVFLGRGDGTFGSALPTTFAAPELWKPEAVAADFNGDGRMDLVLGDSTNPAHGDLTYVLLYGTGDGSFDKPVLAKKAGVSQFYNLKAADVTGDKKADLIASGQLEIEGGSQWIVMLTGSAKDKLGRPTRMGSAVAHEIGRELAYRDQYRWELADVDGDGVTELIAPPVGFAAVDRDRPNNTGDGNYGVCVVKIGRGAKFQDPACYGSTSEYAPEVVALADFNGDGQLDLATGPKSHSYLDSIHGVYVHLNKGQGQFEQTPTRADDREQTDITNFWALHAGDVTGDGKADIVMVGRGSKGAAVLVLPGSGKGTFGRHLWTPVSKDDDVSAPLVRFGAFAGPGTLGFAVYEWRSEGNGVRVFSGACKR